MPPRNIGLFGGSFNPIHYGHLQVAEHTRERLQLDHVYFIPTGDPPHKPRTSLAPAHHRLQMVNLALQGHSHFSIIDLEACSPEISYTYDTLKILRQKMFPNEPFFFIVGLDAFLEFPTWKQAESLLTLSNFVIISRPGTQFKTLSQLQCLPKISSSALDQLDNGHTTRHTIPLTSHTELILLALPPSPISASTIRDRIDQELPLQDWLPASVESYILNHNVFSNLKR
jgi:nicotinate-nucleotide adenylyltransferase